MAIDFSQFKKTPGTGTVDFSKFKKGGFRYDVPAPAGSVETREAKIARLRSEADAAAVEAKKASSLGGLAANFGKAFVQNIAPSQVGLGNTISAIVDDRATKDAALVDQTTTNQTNLIRRIREAEAAGRDTTRLKQAYNSIAPLAKEQTKAVTDAKLPTTFQAAGQLGGTALDVLTAGTFGKAARGAKSFALAPKVPGVKTLATAAGAPELGAISGQKAATLFSKQGAGNIAKGAGIGYASDVALGAQGLRGEDRDSAGAFIPGLGTALGAGLPAVAATSKSISNRVTPDGRANALIQKRQKALEDLDGLASLKKVTEKGRERGIDIKKVLAETDVLHGSVSKDGKISTKGDGGAVEMYTKEFIDGNEAIVSDALKKEARAISPGVVEKKLRQALRESGIQGAELIAAENKIKNEIAGYMRRAGQTGAIPLETIHQAKIDKYSNINFMSDAATKKYDKTVAKALKELVEDNTTSISVKDTNRELAKHFAVIDYLEKLDGKTVKGGRLGKYFAQTVGAIVGSNFGPLGAVVGAEAGGLVRGAQMGSTFRGKTGRTQPQAAAITQAQDYLNSPPLPLQSSNSVGNLQRSQMPTMTGTTISPNINPGIPPLGGSAKGVSVDNMGGKANALGVAALGAGTAGLAIANNPDAQEVVKGIPEAAGNLAMGAVEQTGKGLGLLTKGFGEGTPTDFLGIRDEENKMTKAVALPKIDPTGMVGNTVRTAKGGIEAAPGIFEGFSDISTKLLEKLKGRSTVSRQFISDLTNSPDLKQTEKDLIRRMLDEEDMYFHSTNKASANNISKSGFEARLGDNSDGVTSGEGVWLYPEKESADLFGENIVNRYRKDIGKKPLKMTVLETTVGGKIYTLPKSGDNITQLAGDKDLIDKLRKDGFVGMRGQELGQDQVFVFEPKAVKLVQNATKSDQIDVPTFAEKVKAELLPLQVSDKNTASMPHMYGKYESVVLPDELRGPVANYTERVYESPVKTSAGDVHFGSLGKEGYFGHTRVEDLPGTGVKGRMIPPRNMSPEGRAAFDKRANELASTGTTRRVIEVQSDLFQKGRLENEGLSPLRGRPSDYLTEAETKRYDEYMYEGKRNLPQDKVDDFMALDKKIAEAKKAESAGRDTELSKLEPYKNNAAHFRMIREEVKQAALDGKTKLQFPTGETAMKIEGLGGEYSSWYGLRPNGGTGAALKIEDLAVGKEVKSGTPGNWIITDVLGDGKFKAVPKQRVDQLKYGKASEEDTKNILDSVTETFDISGKVDTENPIYKFYEKEVGKYLKNKYGAELITDPQGVKWWQIDVKKDYGKLPVEAFGVLGTAALGTAATTPAINRKEN